MEAMRLDAAQQAASPVEQFPPGAFDIDNAYRIQQQLIELRCQRGEQVCGIKLGFTSRAKMQQMGVEDLIWGQLTDAMQIEHGATLEQNSFGGRGLIHARAEPEIAFRLSRDIDHELDRKAARDSIESICAAIEVIDSRYQNFKFSLPDVVADNASSAAFCLGPWQDWQEFMQARAGSSGAAPLHLLGVRLAFGEQVVQCGCTAAVLGDPLESLVQASRLASAAGLVLRRGWVCLVGSPTAAEFLPRENPQPIRVRAEVATLPAVEFQLS